MKKVTLDLDEFKKGAYDFPAFLRELVGRDPWKANPSQFGKPQRELALWIADQIEAQTKPPLKEPGIGGVVKAACVHGGTVKTWVRVGPVWYVADEPKNPDDWDSLVDPILVREGVDG